MFSPKGLGYDRSLTIFSPDGRLYQVEYANEAVRRGSTSLGLKCDDGLILLSLKGASKHTSLIEPDSLNKIFIIDDHIAVTGAGLFSDLQFLVHHSRIYAQTLRLTYGEPASAEMIAKNIANIKQTHTQLAGYRPFGVATITIGYNNDASSGLYYTEPSGSYFSYKAIAIGDGSTEITDKLETQYNSGSISNLLPIICQILQSHFNEIQHKDLDIITISEISKTINRLSTEDINSLFKFISKGEENA